METVPKITHCCSTSKLASAKKWSGRWRRGGAFRPGTAVESGSVLVPWPSGRSFASLRLSPPTCRSGFVPACSWSNEDAVCTAERACFPLQEDRGKIHTILPPPLLSWEGRCLEEPFAVAVAIRIVLVLLLFPVIVSCSGVFETLGFVFVFSSW